MYEHECEKIVADKLSEWYRLEKAGYKVMDFTLDVCELNGWYNRVQEDRESLVFQFNKITAVFQSSLHFVLNFMTKAFISSTRKFCADKYKIKIGNYTLTRDDPEAENMNCREYFQNCYLNLQFVVFTKTKIFFSNRMCTRQFTYIQLKYKMLSQRKLSESKYKFIENLLRTIDLIFVYQFNRWFAITTTNAIAWMKMAIKCLLKFKWIKFPH